jgi:hypothetical protein
MPHPKKSEIHYTGRIQKAAIQDPELRFSFRFFDPSDKELCPEIFQDGYVQTLMQRLSALSTWTVTRFTSKQEKSLRNHTHDWTKTSRPNGFSHLNDVFKAYPAWQFELTANKFGRVHGIIIGDTFFVVWLDQNHRLYPGQA